MSISKPTDGMGVFCMRCNAEMDADASVCPVCGEPRLLSADTVVTGEQPTRVIEETVVDEPAPVLVEERPTVPPWLAAVLGILATLVIVLLIVVFAQSDDDDKADTTTTVPTTVPATVTAPTAPPPSVVTVPVPVVVTPAPTQPPATAPPTVATVTTAAP